MGKEKENEVRAEEEQTENETPDTVEEQKEQAVQPEELCEEDRLRQQVAELEDKLLRTAAEFDNYKKRIARQYDDMVRSANDALLLELLSVIDNFERALEHTGENSDLESFYRGVELILNQMRDLLQKYNITPIEAVGQPFDPNLHEAVLQLESEEFEEGVVAVEIARGYRQGQRVIRHTRVGVSAGKKQDDDK